MYKPLQIGENVAVQLRFNDIYGSRAYDPYAERMSPDIPKEKIIRPLQGNSGLYRIVGVIEELYNSSLEVTRPIPRAREKSLVMRKMNVGLDCTLPISVGVWEFSDSPLKKGLFVSGIGFFTGFTGFTDYRGESVKGKLVKLYHAPKEDGSWHLFTLDIPEDWRTLEGRFTHKPSDLSSYRSSREIARDTMKNVVMLPYYWLFNRVFDVIHRLKDEE